MSGLPNLFFLQNNRDDIDGLRSIAVLLVIAFHAFPNTVTGGFVGVDIFFSISGFLITGILLSDIDSGSLSLRDFYTRRIRRIFPALFVVMLSCLVFGWFDLFPDEYKQIGRHLVGGAGFVANFFLWLDDNYFSNVAETKPLLHLWSLGVEEQFYIVWPIVLWIFCRRGSALAFFLLILVAMSFGANIYLTSVDPTQSFYSPWTRFWELALGGLLAIWMKFKKCSGGARPHVENRVFSQTKVSYANHAYSVVGAGLLVISTLWISKEFKFPGWYALLPTTGACLIILAGPQAFINKMVLSQSFMVGTGKISYPLYLWHWPLLSFATILGGQTPPATIKVAAIFLSFALAWLTTRYVEDPIRKRGRLSTQLLVLLMLGLAAAGGAIVVCDGARSRSHTMEVAGLEADELLGLPMGEGWVLCPDRPIDTRCRTMDPRKPPEVMVIGDSHAEHFSFGIGEYYKKKGINVASVTAGDCRPFFEISRNGSVFFDCQHIIDNALVEAMNSANIKTIYLGGYANKHIQGAFGLSGADGYENDQDKASVARRLAIFQEGMSATLSRLGKTKKNIVFLVDAPELYFEPRKCMARRPLRFSWGGDAPCSVSRRLFDERNKPYHLLVDQARRDFPDVRFIDTWRVFCDDSKCYGSINDKILFRDRHHLSVMGSRYVFERLAGELP